MATFAKTVEIFEAVTDFEFLPIFSKISSFPLMYHHGCLMINCPFLHMFLEYLS